MKHVSVLIGIMALVLLVPNLGGCPTGTESTADDTGLFNWGDWFGTGDDNQTVDNGDDATTDDTDGTSVDEDDGTNDDGDGTDDNQNNGNTGSSTLTVVKTNIVLHCQSGLLAGDDLIVYGYGSLTGVDYIKPSAGDTVGRGIPHGDTFNVATFAIAGQKIALAKEFQITIFDTATGVATAILTDDLRLATMASKPYEVKNLHGNGNYFVAACDMGVDGKIVRVIDVTGATPAIITFDKDPAEYSVNITQVALDGARVFASTSDGVFYKYDLAQPDATPTTYDVSGYGGLSADKWAASDGYIIFRDYSTESVWLLNTATTDPPVQMTANPGGGALAIGSDEFCYYAYRDSDDANGNHLRSAIGKTPGPGATLAGNAEIDGSTNNNNFVGWGQTCAVSPDGKYVFIAGWEAMGQGEYLQVSTGGAFQVVAAPGAADAYGCPGTDVQLSNNVCAFKTGASISTFCEETVVGYIRLP